ncbi:MAG: glycosyltransferase family 2 protein, partial [Acidimicrobiales bacterium]
MTSRALIAVDSPDAGSWAVAVLRAARRAEVVVIGTPADAVPVERLTDLLTGPWSIGAVLPVSRHDDGANRDLDPDTLASDQPVVAVRSAVLRSRPIEASLRDVETVTAAVIRETAKTGLRVVSEPEWRRDGAPELPPLGPTDQRILVVTDFATDNPVTLAERSRHQLLRTLTQQTEHTHVTLAVVDGAWSAPATRAWVAQGVVVATGPRDWRRWFYDRAGMFTHAFLTTGGAASSFWDLVATTQSQATKVLVVPASPLRTIPSLRMITPEDERPGLDYTRVLSEARTLARTGECHAIWCESGLDARTLAALVPAVPVTAVPLALESTATVPGWADREGIAVFAHEGADVIAANEDAAVSSLRSVVTPLRRAGFEAPVTVLSDWPSPMLELAAERAGATVAPLLATDEVCRRSRVALLGHHFGTGGTAGAVTCLAAGLPFVGPLESVSGFELGALRSMSLFGEIEDIRYRVRRVHDDRVYWEHVQQALLRFVAQRHSQQVRTEAAKPAIAQLGITPSATKRRWPPARPQTGRIDRCKPVTVPLRPAGMPEPRPLEEPEGTTEPERYRQWRQRHGPTAAALRAIGDEVRSASYQPSISVVMPTYNTDPDLLLAAVDSLRTQVYPTWELCIGDDCSNDPATVALLDEIEPDPSISVVRLDAHAGISGATNAALRSTTGEFVAFMDHDDLLKPHALAQVVRWLNADPDLDVIYSDEDKLDGDQLVQPHLKPDWSPDQLMSQNYMSHLTVIRKSLLDQLGGLRPDFDGSQDYDLLLRAVEVTTRIAHIPEPLYTWRLAAGSAAQGLDAKPYALAAAERALGEAIERRGHHGSAVLNPALGVYRSRYAIPGSPEIAIIIPTRDRVRLLRNCIGSVVERSTYR